MPNSCRSILTRLLRNKRIKQWEHDKLLRNLKGIEWHPYPQELPDEGAKWYLVTRSSPNRISMDCFTYSFQWLRGNVIAWAEMPEPYKEVYDEKLDY